MRVTLGKLRSLIREALGGSSPNEAYDRDLMDDPSIAKKSAYVPDDIKRPIKKYLTAMGLTSKKKKRPRSS